MTTGEFIALLRTSVNNAVSRSTLLTMANIVQNELLAINSSITRTKPDPNLVTTQTVFSYTLAAGIRTVARVYSKDDRFTDFGGTLINHVDIHNEGRNDAGSIVFRVPVTITNALTSTDTVTLVFPEERDPGTTTVDYFLEQYNWPEQLTSDQIPLSIPDNYVLQVFRSRILMLVFQDEFGNSFEWERKYKEEIKDWKIYSNSGLVIGNQEIEPRFM